MTDKWFYIALAIIGGISISPQGAINAVLGRYIGNLQAALVSFAVGFMTLAVMALLLFSRYPGAWKRLFEAPKYALTGGILGAIIVYTCLMAVPRIGATATVMAILMGQVISSIIIDRYGLFGVPVVEFDAWRIVGIALLAVSLPLVVR